MKNILIVILVVISLGCNLEPETFLVEFRNESSYMVTVIPNGQNWESFILGIGVERTIEIEEETCYYRYPYNSEVVPSHNGNVVTFKDRL